MRIATWNVNGIRARERGVCAWLARETPDLLLLQEIKCEASAFPPCFAGMGYAAEIVGQKGFNGVAALSREPARVLRRALPGHEDDPQARFVEVELRGLRVGNLYLPNGNSGGETGYAYKLAWMAALTALAQERMEDGAPFLMAGDYNVCPEDRDFAAGVLGAEDALVRPETRAAWRRLLWMGLTDAIRAVRPEGAVYTFWDYQAGCWQRDRGLRIDHALLSPEVAERLVDAVPMRDERGLDQPSDHVPVMLTIADES